ncbi:MAG TPA: hypothetical protein VL689_18250 [Paraburkholderia sp.]|jgi:hypothetical protein|nr:hypothetical protein [Paraburkholderia sp.]
MSKPELSPLYSLFDSGGARLAGPAIRIRKGALAFNAFSLTHKRVLRVLV